MANSGNAPGAQAFTIRLLPSETAEDSALMSELAGLVNEVYEGDFRIYRKDIGTGGRRLMRTSAGT
jgi:hypothetical protein